MNDKKNILIAEDDPMILQILLKGILAKRHSMYKPYVCIDGYETLQSLKQHPIDCLVLDLDSLPSVSNRRGCSKWVWMPSSRWGSARPLAIRFINGSQVAIRFILNPLPSLSP